MFESIDEKVYKKIISQIEELVLSGKLKKGDKLPPERKLAEQLGVSRNSLREALGALTFMGLIETKQGGGSTITTNPIYGIYMPISLMFTLDGGNIFDVLFFRYMMEVQAVKIISKKCQTEEFINLLASLERIKTTKDIKDLVMVEIDFHSEIVKLTGNRLMNYIMQAVLLLAKEQISASHDSTSLKTDLREMIYKNHKEIIDALMIKNTDRAVNALSKGFEVGFPFLDFSNYHDLAGKTI